MFHMLYFNNWPNFIVWLPLLLDILDNKCIVIVYLLGCHEAIFMNDQKFKTKIAIFSERKQLLVWNFS